MSSDLAKQFNEMAMESLKAMKERRRLEHANRKPAIVENGQIKLWVNPTAHWNASYEPADGWEERTVIDVKELMGNPYLQEFVNFMKHQPPNPFDFRAIMDRQSPEELCKGIIAKGEFRDHMVHRYAWAVPHVEQIELIRKYRPMWDVTYEVGAGSGYWARMVTEKWQDHTYYAYDPYLSHAFTHRYYEVQTEPLEREGRISFMIFIWPSYDEQWAAEMLVKHKPRRVAYLGEGSGGCTADDYFHTCLDDFYEEIDTVSHWQWDGIHDHLTIYQCKE